MWRRASTRRPLWPPAAPAEGANAPPPMDPYNLRLDRGLASFDTRHRFVNTYVYDLPFGRTRRWLQSGPGSWILGGWQTSGILQLQTGFPFTINLTGDTANVGARTGGIFIRP